MSEPKGSGDAMRVDTALIRELADLLTEKDLTEIEVEDADRRVVVKRKLSYAPAAAAAQAPPPAPPAGQPQSPPASTAEDEASHPGAVKSPMVGTVYLSGSPGAAPFVAPGVTVAAGDTLVIVEAMKVMNPITAPRAGTVRQVLVQDAQPVEYDQPLVIID